MENITEQYRSLLPDDLYVAMGDIGVHFSDHILTGVERKEYDSFNNQRRKNEFLSTRGLIKELATDMGLDETIFEIEKDGLGKPFGIYSDSRYNLSLAHTNEKVICGISSRIPLGIDIEPVDRSVNPHVRKRLLHPEEYDDLSDESLIRLWTLKEALVKLEGKGLRTNLNKLRLIRRSDTLFTGIFEDDKTARISSFIHAGHWLAVAVYR